MTISNLAFELEDHSLDRPVLYGYWNNNGDLLIIAQDTNERLEWGRTSVHIMPFELDKILKITDAKVGDVLHHDDRVRPGLFAEKYASGAILHENNCIELYSDDMSKRSSIKAPRKVWQDLLLACCKERDRYIKEVGIAPLMGTKLSIEDDVKTADLEGQL